MDRLLHRKGNAASRSLMSLIVLWSAMIGAASATAQTAPGTIIVNTAAVRFTQEEAERQVASNSVTLIVAERLDIGLSPGGGGVPVLTQRPTPVPVTLTNNGSGREAFTVKAIAMVPTATVVGIAIDTDRDGQFDPAVDAMLTGPTPVLPPGGTLSLLAIVAPMPGMAPADGTLSVTARAVTGSGTPADSVDGGGDGGGDAVVGETGAVATAELPFVAVMTDPPGDAPTLAKTQAVLAPDGSSRAIGGAVVTYTLVARFPGATRDARIDDPIPAGTTYVAGSLTLDGALLDDADVRAGGAVGVTLGDVAAASVRTVRFQVRLP